MMQKSVSVIIPAYNAAPSIARAVDSALAEPEVGAVVVVDDCSTDETRAVARAADDGSGRLSVHMLSRNSGPSAARNFALAYSDLPLVALLDSDDFFLPGRFARMFAAAGDAWDALADNIVFVGADRLSSVQAIAASRGGIVHTRTLELAEFIIGNISRPLRQRTELGFIKPVFRRATLQRLALQYDPSLRLGEDFIFYCQAMMRGARFKLISSCGYVAVERAHSLSGLHRTQDLEALLHADRGLLEEALASDLPEADLHVLDQHIASLITKVDVRNAIELAHRRGRYLALATLSLTPRRLGRILWGMIGDRLGNAAASRRRELRKLFGEEYFL